MRTFQFTVKGNHKNEKGNPVPYTRMTQGTKFGPKALSYADWKEYVRNTFLAHCVDQNLLNHEDFRGLVYALPGLKPIVASKNKVVMHIMITFMNDAHADSDNVFKGIADALFQNDKYVAGSFDYQYGEAGKVDITIIM